MFYLHFLLFLTFCSSCCGAPTHSAPVISSIRPPTARSPSLIVEEVKPDTVPIRFWSFRLDRWLTKYIPVLGTDTVQDIANKVVKTSRGELNSSAVLYLDEIELPRNKRLFIWMNEIRNGGILEIENNYEPKKPRNPYNNINDI